MVDVIAPHNSSSFGPLGQRKPLGVVGGMGSFATAYFLEVLARKTRVERDQDHIPFVALSLPSISDRSQAISIGSDLPLRQILERAYWLEKAGCGAIAIPCNTAHLWVSAIEQALSVTLINMIEVTRRAIHDTRGTELDNLRSISLGTKASMQHTLYARPRAELSDGLLCVVNDIQIAIAQIINAVKSGKIPAARNNLYRIIHYIRSFDIDIIILACSELSAISGDLVDDNDIIDPINILADACVEWWMTEGHSLSTLSADITR